MRMRRNQSPRALLVGGQNGAAALETNGLAAFLTIEHRVTVTSNSTPRDTPERTENMFFYVLSTQIHFGEKGASSHFQQAILRYQQDA